jgi:hypothetical protein
MSNTKRHYSKGLDFLKQAQVALEEAAVHFSISSNSLDDFPTARHEISDLSIEAKKIKELVDKLESKAFINRIK